MRGVRYVRNLLGYGSVGKEGSRLCHIALQEQGQGREGRVGGWEGHMSEGEGRVLCEECVGVWECRRRGL